jgi:hypothetical protein
MTCLFCCHFSGGNRHSRAMLGEIEDIIPAVQMTWKTRLHVGRTGWMP